MSCDVDGNLIPRNYECLDPAHRPSFPLSERFFGFKGALYLLATQAIDSSGTRPYPVCRPFFTDRSRSKRSESGNGRGCDPTTGSLEERDLSPLHQIPAGTNWSTPRASGFNGNLPLVARVSSLRNPFLCLSLIGVYSRIINHILVLCFVILAHGSPINHIFFGQK